MAQNNRTDYLRKELESCPLPEEAVNARLRRVYAELPDRLPVKRHMPTWVKRGLCTAASLLAACGLMMGINGANPALAESIPFVGSIFRAINDVGFRPTENGEATKGRIADLAVDVSAEEGSTVVIPSKSPLAGPMTATLKEVYYDGSYVFAGVELQLDTDEERLTERNGPGYDILINGESQVRHGEDGLLAYPRDKGNGFCDMSDYFLTKLEHGRYAMQRAFRVPDALQGADSLDITLCFEGFDILVNNGSFELHFTAQKTEVSTREIDCSGVEKNGVRLISAASSPAVTCLVVEYPDSYVNPACAAVFDDGIMIGGTGGATTTPMEDGTLHRIEVYAGLRETETRNLVWRLFDKNGSQQTEAVFVLDFQNGTAHVGSEADLKEPPAGDYACGAEAIKNLTEGYIVEKYHADQRKPLLYLASGGSKPEDLHAEVWQDGNLVDSADIHQGDTGWSESGLYWEYGGQEDRIPGTEHLSCILLLQNGYVGLDLSQPLTVRVYNSSRELVLEQEITLEVRE